jgi:hypothetical protein
MAVDMFLKFNGVTVESKDREITQISSSSSPPLSKKNQKYLPDFIKGPIQEFNNKREDRYFSRLFATVRPADAGPNCATTSRVVLGR